MTLDSENQDWGDPVTKDDRLGRTRRSREEVEELIDKLTQDLDELLEEASREDIIEDAPEEGNREQVADVLERHQR